MRHTLTLLGLLLPLSPLMAQSGSLDGSFDNDGIWTQDISGTGIDAVYGMAQQPDGKIVLAGYSADGTNANCFFYRLLEDGTPDSTFSEDGLVLLDVGLGANDRLYDVAVMDDGRIVGVGYVSNGTTDDLLVIRLTPDGEPDVFFGGSGIVKMDVSLGADERANAVAIQPDGKIVAAGYMDNGSNNDWLVVRLLSDGTPDPSLDTDGSVSLDVDSNDDVLEGVAIAPDGKIVATGVANDGTSDNVLVIRLDSLGQPDNDFSSDGKFFADMLLGGTDYAMDCEVFPDGGVIVSGYVISGGTSDGMLLRLSETGVPVGSFGSSGMATFDISLGNNDRFSQVAILPDGSILAGGYTIQPTTDNDMLVIKVDGEGALDISFNGSGIAHFDAGASVPDPMRSMALQQDGKILLGGYSSSKATVIRVEHDLPVAIATGSEEIGLTAYPNPFSETLSLAPGNEPCHWALLTADGRQVAGGQLNGAAPLTLQTGSLAPGIYLLRANTGGNMKTLKVLHTSH